MTPEIKENEAGGIDVTKDGRTIRLSRNHRVYAEKDLVKYGMFDTYADSVEWSGDLLDCSGPHLHRYKDGIEFELSCLPEEAGAIEDYLRYFKPDKSSVIFDLGAHCGVSTYYFAQVSGLVVAVEPDPINFACLYRNSIRHGLNNVAVVCGAVSGANGWTEFNAEGSMGSTLVCIQPNRNLVGRISVATRTLQSLIDQYGEPDLIKMDIEGAELEVLSAALSGGLLGRLKSKFAIDTCHSIGGALTTKRVEIILQDAGYTTKSERSNGMCTWAWRDSN